MNKPPNHFACGRPNRAWAAGLALLLMALAALLGPSPGQGEEESVPNQAAYKVLVFAPQFSHYREGHTYSKLFRTDLEKRWPAGQVELRFFPWDSLNDPAAISRTLVNLAEDLQVRGLVIGEAPVGSIDGVARLRAKRPDIYVIAIDPHEKMERMAKTATLTLALNHPARGFLYPTLAHRMGARTLVYFSLPRYLSLPGFGRQYRIMSQVTQDLNMIMVSDLTGPDPLDPATSANSLEDYLARAVRRYLDQYGPNTAFVAVSTAHSDLLIPIVMRQGGAVLPAVQPSLLLGYPEALDMVEETRALFGQWRRLLAAFDEKIMAMTPMGPCSATCRSNQSRPSENGPGGQLKPAAAPPLRAFAAWTYPYPHTVMLAMADLTVAAIEDQEDIYKRENLDRALDKYSPGIKWQVSTQMDYLNDRLVPQALLVIQDTYWFGHGYQGFTQLNIPAKYYRIK